MYYSVASHTITWNNLPYVAKTYLGNFLFKYQDVPMVASLATRSIRW